jgi:hypothetical protein
MSKGETMNSKTDYEYFLNELSEELNSQNPANSFGYDSHHRDSHIKVGRFHLTFDKKGGLEHLVFHGKDGQPTHWPLRKAKQNLDV